MNGHHHGTRSHLLGMLGAAAAVLVFLLLAGRSFGEALPLTAALACPLMMIGMMFMMGRGHGAGGEPAGPQDGGHGTPVGRPEQEHRSRAPAENGGSAAQPPGQY